jgi:Arc/MetJ-type ribon-helix-helix transcriptional regulator
MRIVNIRLEKEMLRELDFAVNEGLYASRTEFIREAIRKNLLEEKKKEFFKDLERIRKKINVKRNSPVLTKEEREEAFAQLLKEIQE